MANKFTGEKAADFREKLIGAVGGVREGIADAASKGVDQMSGGLVQCTAPLTN